MKTEIYPQGFPGTSTLQARARLAAKDLDLDPDIQELEIVLDAPEFAGHGFWTVRRNADQSLRATLYGSARDVLTAPGLRDDPRQLDDEEFVQTLPASRLDVLAADRWLHRNLLQLDDLVKGRVQPRSVPAPRAAGLQSVWDVWTDGRLRRWQQPGLSQAERRRIFFRAFAAHGLLLPRHWATFHRLWDGRYGDQEGLLRALEELPTP